MMDDDKLREDETPVEPEGQAPIVDATDASASLLDDAAAAESLETPGEPDPDPEQVVPGGDDVPTEPAPVVPAPEDPEDPVVPQEPTDPVVPDAPEQPLGVPVAVVEPDDHVELVQPGADDSDVLGAHDREALAAVDDAEDEFDPQDHRGHEHDHAGHSHDDHVAAATPADQLAAGAKRLRGRVTDRLSADGVHLDGQHAADLVKSPLVVAGALSALLATVAGLVVSLVLWVVLSDSLVTGLGLPRQVGRLHHLWGGFCTFWLALQQVPLSGSGQTYQAPALLALVGVLALLVIFARRTLGMLGSVPVMTQRIALGLFSVTFAVLSLLVSLFSYKQTMSDSGFTESFTFHASHGWAFVLPLIWALVASVVALGKTSQELVPARTRQLWHDHVREPLRVLIAVLGVATVFGFISALFSVLGNDHKRQNLQIAIVQVLNEGVDFFRNGALVGLKTVNHDVNALHFIYVLVFAIGTVWIGALFAGFSSSKHAKAKAPNQGILVGGLVGPVWAVALLILDELTKGVHGSSPYSGTKTFFFVLIIGAVLGALGGVLATRTKGGSSLSDLRSAVEGAAGRG